jgi:hypothetical protein
MAAKRAYNVELQKELQEMIDRKAEQRRRHRELVVKDETEQIRQTESLRDAEQRRLKLHREHDKHEITEQLQGERLKPRMILL